MTPNRIARPCTTLACLALLCLCSPAIADDALYPPGLEAGTLLLEPTTFRSASGAIVQGDQGRLVVPEHRSNESSNLIELAFVRLRSTAESPRAPLFYLAGGPGGSSSWMPSHPPSLQNWIPVLEVCDVVFLDQRATGASRPRLRYEFDVPTPADLFADRESAKTHYLERVRQAAAHFRAAGVDFDGYTSVESAHDIDAVRQALGYERMSLMGFSYGTHLAMATMRHHGDRLDDVILMAVEPLDGTHKLPLNADVQWAKLTSIVAADPLVGPEVGDLTALLDRVLAKLDAEPVTVPVYDRSAGIVSAQVGAGGLLFLLRLDLGDASDLPVFPRLLTSIDRGELAELQWFVQKRWGSGDVNLMGLLMDGASGASPERWAMIEAQSKRSRFRDVVNFFWPEIDDATGVRDLGEDYRRPLTSDVRTLLLSGSLDYNTPPHQAERVRWGLTDARHLVVENAGHEQIITHRDVQRAMMRFLRGEEVRDVAPVAPPLRFVPLSGFDPDIAHPSAAPTQRFTFLLMTEGKDAALAHHRSFRQRYPDYPTAAEMNRLGYTLLRAGQTDTAIDVFTLNRDDYPEDYNTWDSLAEAHAEQGDHERAIAFYEKSLELNPDNENATRMLGELGAQR